MRVSTILATKGASVATIDPQTSVADVVDELEDAIRALTEWLQHPSVSMDPSTIRSITEFQQARLDRALQAVERQRQKGSEELEEKRMDEDAGNEGEQEA